MNKINCLLTRKFVASDIEYIKSKLNFQIELLIPDKYDENSLEAYIENKNIEIILGIIPSERIIRKAKKLSLIQIPWNGLDNIEIPNNFRSEIKICNSHSNSVYTAEYAVSLMLSLIKWIPVHDKSLRKNDWKRPGCESGFIPPDPIRGKDIGILGFGHLGYEISKLLSGFSVNIMAVNKSGVDKFNSGISIHNLKMLEVMLRKSDIIFIALPLTIQTINIIGESELRKMKETAYVINVSRGNVIEEEALYNVLLTKKIAGAAIDVWYNYPQRDKSNAAPSKYPFNELENVIMSPHRAGFVKNMLPHLDDAIANINRYAEGEELINLVNVTELY